MFDLLSVVVAILIQLFVNSCQVLENVPYSGPGCNSKALKDFNVML